MPLKNLRDGILKTTSWYRKRVPSEKPSHNKSRNPMKILDGQEAIEKIREMEVQTGIRQNNKAFIIMTTSRAEPDDVKNAMKAGAT